MRSLGSSFWRGAAILPTMALSEGPCDTAVRSIVFGRSAAQARDCCEKLLAGRACGQKR